MFNFIDTAALDKKIATERLSFSKYLFWDSELEDIDLAKHKKAIIERVITRGFLKDFYIILKLYSHAEIVDTIKWSRILDKKTANFCSIYFKIPLNQIHASPYYS